MSAYPSRKVVRLIEPAAEPVSLAEAKSFLRIDTNDDDALIGDLVAAARIMAEEQTGKAFITQSWRIVYDGCPPPVVILPYGPVQSVSAVTSVASDGAETVIAAQSYHLNAREDLVFEAAPTGHQVRIDYVAGYGDAAAGVPVDLTQAILLHVAHLYEHRDNLNPPLAAQLAYSYHREVRL